MIIIHHIKEDSTKSYASEKGKVFIVELGSPFDPRYEELKKSKLNKKSDDNAL